MTGAAVLIETLCREVVGRSGSPTVLGGIRAEEYAVHQHRLPGASARRAAHFFSESDRVWRGIAAWRAGALTEFGALMTASGDSSIRNYECGSPPLIDLYEILVATPGVYGAHFSGAGFRGCCVALVKLEDAEQAASQVREEYARRHPDLAKDASVVLCNSDNGAAILERAGENGG